MSSLIIVLSVYVGDGFLDDVYLVVERGDCVAVVGVIHADLLNLAPKITRSN